MLAFNQGGDGFYTPIDNLPGIYHYFNNGKELPCIIKARSNDSFGKVNPAYAELDEL